MKHLKTKLMASLVMLIISAILMSTASYAWITISTNPEISKIETTVGANGNLEIALAKDDSTAPVASTTADAGKNITWGNLVDLENFAFGELKPVQFEAGVISAPEFGLDGRIAKLTNLTASTVTATKTLNTNFKDGVIYEYKDTKGVVWAYRVDFYLRSNVDGTVSLGTAADRGDGVATERGAGWGAGSTITAGSNVTIVFWDGTAYVKATDTSGVLTADVTTLVANTEKRVSMFIYVDGATLTNATMLTTDKPVSINIQFKHSATLDPLDVEGSGYDKTTSSGAGTT